MKAKIAKRSDTGAIKLYKKLIDKHTCTHASTHTHKCICTRAQGRIVSILIQWFSYLLVSSVHASRLSFQCDWNQFFFSATWEDIYCVYSPIKMVDKSPHRFLLFAAFIFVLLVLLSWLYDLEFHEWILWAQQIRVNHVIRLSKLCNQNRNCVLFSIYYPFIMSQIYTRIQNEDKKNPTDVRKNIHKTAMECHGPNLKYSINCRRDRIWKLDSTRKILFFSRKNATKTSDYKNGNQNVT